MFLKEFLKKIILKKKIGRRQNKKEKLPSMQIVNLQQAFIAVAGRQSKQVLFFQFSAESADRQYIISPFIPLPFHIYFIFKSLKV